MGVSCPAGGILIRNCWQDIQREYVIEINSSGYLMKRIELVLERQHTDLGEAFLLKKMWREKMNLGNTSVVKQANAEGNGVS